MEAWRPVPIPGYEHLYEVSDLGRVRRIKTGYVMTASTHKDGYLCVYLTRHARDKRCLIHTLVVRAFLDYSAEAMQQNSRHAPTTNHINGIKTDNRLVNLEIIPRSANTKDAWTRRTSDTVARGSRAATAKLHEDHIPLIFTMRAQGMTHKRIAEHFGVSPSRIQSALKRHTWKHVNVPCKPEDFAHLASNRARGSRAPFAKLTEQDIVLIKQMRAQGMIYRVIAAHFNVTIGAIAHIIYGISWRHLP